MGAGREGLRYTESPQGDVEQSPRVGQEADVDAGGKWPGGVGQAPMGSESSGRWGLTVVPVSRHAIKQGG